MIQIYVKGNLDTKYKRYDNDGDVVIHPGTTDLDFRCRALNSFPVLWISWTTFSYRSSTFQETLSTESAEFVNGSLDTNNTNGLFDFNSYLTVNQTMSTCTEVVCRVRNEAIDYLGQQDKWRRNVIVRVLGNVLFTFTHSLLDSLMTLG